MMIAKSVSMLFFISAAVAVLLAGCSNSRPQLTDANSKLLSSAQKRTGNATAAGLDENPQSSQPAPAPSKDTRPLIVAFGDSLTAGYGTKAGESYPDYLQKELNARGYRYRVLNAGISGNTSKDGVIRARKIAAMYPAIAIVAFGGNDGLRGIPIADTEMNLASIITTFHDAHAKVVLGGITLPPNYGSDYISKFNAMYEKLSQDTNSPLLPFMLKDVYGTPGDMQNDGIHATAKGNRQVAKNFLPLLLPMLHKSPHPQSGASASLHQP